jgi:hypothetical protein
MAEIESTLELIREDIQRIRRAVVGWQWYCDPCDEGSEGRTGFSSEEEAMAAAVMVGHNPEDDSDGEHSVVVI